VFIHEVSPIRICLDFKWVKSKDSPLRNQDEVTDPDALMNER